MGLYEGAMRALYGHGLMWDAFSYANQNEARGTGAWFVKAVTALGFTGGCCAIALILAPVLWRSRAWVWAYRRGHPAPHHVVPGGHLARKVRRVSGSRCSGLSSFLAAWLCWRFQFSSGSATGTRMRSCFCFGFGAHSCSAFLIGPLTDDPFFRWSQRSRFFCCGASNLSGSPPTSGLTGFSALPPYFHCWLPRRLSAGRFCSRSGHRDSEQVQDLFPGHGLVSGPLGLPILRARKRVPRFRFNEPPDPPRRFDGPAVQQYKPQTDPRKHV